MQSATITRRVNNAQLSPPPLNSSNCQDSGRVSQQGFKWLFACISRVHLIFHFGAAMRCFYYLCNADTTTLRSGSNPAAISLPPSLPWGYIYTGRRSQVAEHFATFPLQFSVLLSSGFECTTQSSGQGERGRGLKRGSSYARFVAKMFAICHQSEGQNFFTFTLRIRNVAHSITDIFFALSRSLSLSL